MAKKGKKKVKNGTVPKDTKEKKKVTAKGAVAAKDVASVAVVSERRVCKHLESGVNLEKLSARLKDLETPIKCDDCREAGARGKKGKGKSGVELKAIWMCLECGHFSCGGVGLPDCPHTHAARHARMKQHPLAIKFENHQLRFCFSCDMLVRAGKSEDGVEEKDVFHEVVKMMKVKPSDAAPVLDAEAIWFGKGSILGAENSLAVGAKGGYSVRGLSNLGNTCFFNSVMQNLLALSSLREYFLNLDDSFGPLSASLKKLVSEVETECGGKKNVVSPKVFFGCVCAKAPQFRGYQQQDSHELLRCLLDGLSTEELKARKLDGSWKEGGKSNPVFVDAMFGGQLSNTITCLDCKHSSLVHEPFLDLSLPVPTKKPTSGNTARGRKPKPPPKRIYRPRPKISRDSDTLPSTIGASSCAVQSGDSADAVCSDAEIVANGKSLGTDNLLSTQHAESSQTVENVTTTTDDMSWLDVLDADSNEYSLRDPDLSDSCGPVSKDADTNEYSQMDPDLLDSCGPVSKDAVPTQGDLEFSGGNVSMQIDSLNCSNEGAWLDEHEQVNEKMELNACGVGEAIQSEVEDLALFPFSQGRCYGPWPEKFSEEEAPLLVSELSDAVQSEGLEFHGLHFAQDCSYGPWPQKFSEEETPLLADDSQVLLLPYNEDRVTSCEVPKADIECPLSVPESDSLGFDGLGNLFDEPEVAGPSLNPSYIKGYSSDSEPDEVDDSNAPVSVESCLSFFTKAERLCKKEHAWQCGNCSKVALEKKKLMKSRSEHVVNRDADTTTGISIPSSKETPLCNGSAKGEMVETSDLSHDEKTEGVGDPVACISEELKYRLELTPSAENATSSTLVDDQRYGGFSDGGVQEVVVQTENLSLESEGEEDEDQKKNEVKVERDATKRILINRAPPILTIHLKRFSQDRRGHLSKLNGHVQFNHTIDLKPFVDKSCVDRDDCKYRLVGLVEHSGTMRSGHYVAYVRGESKNARGDDIWYHASDAYVRETSLQEVLRAEAYLLFYERV